MYGESFDVSFCIKLLQNEISNLVREVQDNIAVANLISISEDR